MIRQNAVVRAEGAPWTLAEAAAHLQLSRKPIERLAAAGKIKVIRIGSRVFVPDGEMKRITRDGTDADNTTIGGV